jgi:hypothetical protein
MQGISAIMLDENDPNVLGHPRIKNYLYGLRLGSYRVIGSEIHYKEMWRSEHERYWTYRYPSFLNIAINNEEDFSAHQSTWNKRWKGGILADHLNSDLALRDHLIGNNISSFKVTANNKFDYVEINCGEFWRKLSWEFDNPLNMKLAPLVFPRACYYSAEERIAQIVQTVVSST